MFKPIYARASSFFSYELVGYTDKMDDYLLAMGARSWELWIGRLLVERFTIHKIGPDGVITFHWKFCECLKWCQVNLPLQQYNPPQQWNLWSASGSFTWAQSSRPPSGATWATATRLAKSWGQMHCAVRSDIRSTSIGMSWRHLSSTNSASSEYMSCRTRKTWSSQNFMNGYSA